MRRVHLLVVSLLCLLSSAAPHGAATFTVNSTADVVDANPGDGMCDTGRTAPPTPTTPECTLRAAIQEANALDGTHTIRLPAGTYTLTIAGSGEAEAATGDLDITRSVSIIGIGDGAATTIIQACDSSGGPCTGIDRVFHIKWIGIPSAGNTVTITGVTVRNGAPVGGMEPFEGAGGGILISDGVTVGLTDVVVTSNTAHVGGGIYSFAGGQGGTGHQLTLTNSAVSNNLAISSDGGGGIVSQGRLVLTNSTVDNNQARGPAGGLIVQGFGAITGSTVSRNRASTNGGGIVLNGGALTLINSTISGNSTFALGGGIANNGGTVDLNNVTITNNTAADGGGVWNNVGGPFNVKNTIIARNVDHGREAPDCQGTLTSQGFNLIGDPTNLIGDPTGCTFTPTTGDLVGTGPFPIDPMLGPLADNGGPTQTHALLPGSRALEAGNPALPGSGGNACAATDQRGVNRPQGAACDPGSYELVGVAELFFLSSIVPNRAGNTGSSLAVVSGNGFASGATLKLTGTGQPDIVGNPVTVETVAVATAFDLTGKMPGLWDVVVTNPDGRSATLAGAFTIEEPSAPQLWVDVVGRLNIRIGVPATFYILFGNRGNVDAPGVPLALWTSGNIGFPSLRFQITPPPLQAGQVPTDWSQVPINAVPPAGRSDFTVIPLLLPVVPSGFTGVLELTVTGLQAGFFRIGAGIGSPYFHLELDPQIVDEFTAEARAYAQQALGVEVPLTAVPDLEQYVITSLQSMVARGRNAWVANVGTKPEVYSSAQLLIDLAQFGASRAR